MAKPAKFKPIAPPKPLFTERQMLRLRLMKWLVMTHRVSEWKR